MSAKIDRNLWKLLNPYFKASPRDELGSDGLGRTLTQVRDASSLDAVSAWLQSRDLPHSLTGWLQAKEKRFQDALDRKKLKPSDLEQLLGELEEHGQQHVLLYKVKKAHKVGPQLAPSIVKKALANKKLSGVLGNWTETDAPEKRALVSVRFEDTGALVVKTLETRDTYKVVNNLEDEGGRKLEFKRRTRARRVCLARLHSDGLLEVRLGSLSATSSTHSYVNEAGTFLKSINWLIPPTHFEPVSLKDFKTHLWRVNRSSRTRIAVLSSSLSSTKKNAASFRAKNRKTDASKDTAVQDGNAAFMKVKGSSLRKAELLWYPKMKGDLPRNEVVATLTDELNEFLTTRACSREDYEIAFNDIRQLGKL